MSVGPTNSTDQIGSKLTYIATLEEKYGVEGINFAVLDHTELTTGDCLGYVISLIERSAKVVNRDSLFNSGCRPLK